MKMTHTIALASALMLAAGCAHEKYHAQYDENISPYASDGSPRYNASGGSYSEGGVSAVVNTSQSSAQAGVTADAKSTQPESRSDDAITTQVRESLQRDPEIAPIVPNIQISANNGTVVISGSVQSEAQKRQIESIVHNSGGVVTVKNQLQVSSGGQNGEETPSANQGSESGGAMGQTSRSNEQKSIYSGSTNNVQNQSTSPQLNQYSAPSGPSGQGGTLNPTSVSNNSPAQIYQNSSNNTLNATSRTNSSSHIYHQSNQGQNTEQQNTNSNQMP